MQSDGHRRRCATSPSRCREGEGSFPCQELVCKKRNVRTNEPHLSKSLSDKEWSLSYLFCRIKCDSLDSENYSLFLSDANKISAYLIFVWYTWVCCHLFQTLQLFSASHKVLESISILLFVFDCKQLYRQIFFSPRFLYCIQNFFFQQRRLIFVIVCERKVHF